MSPPPLNRDEAEFLPLAQSVRDMPGSTLWHVTAAVLMIAIAMAVLWAFRSHTDIVVKAQGRVVSDVRIQSVASLETAILKSLHVRDGQHVRAGDLLIALDDKTAQADLLKSKAVLTQADAQLQMAKGMLHRLADVFPHERSASNQHTPDVASHAGLLLESQWQDFIARLTRIDAQIKRHATALPMLTARANDYARLLEQGYVSQSAWMEREQARLDMHAQWQDALHQRAELLARTEREARESLNDASRTVALSQQDIVRAEAFIQRSHIRSPVDGTVQQLSVHTVGGVVAAAHPLMSIAPDSSAVELEALVDNRDIGFVKEGQDASVRFDAFDYTRYGTLPARVLSVSRDSIADEKRGLVYAVRFRLLRDDFEWMGARQKISPGLSASIDIRTGERRMLDYLLSPLIRLRHESFREP